MPENQIKLDQATVDEARKAAANEEYLAFKEGVEKEQEDFQKAFDKLGEEAEAKGVKQRPYKVDALASHVKAIFNTRSNDRYLLEQKWLGHLRNYRGEYSSDILEGIHPNRSRAFIRFIRSKVKIYTSRLTDFVFPANGDKNWGIEPTPIPEANPEKMELMRLQYEEATGQPISPEDFSYLILRLTKKASENMSKEIEDQLSDLRYRDILKNVIHSGCLYGTGVLKGPMVKVRNSKAYVQDGMGQWVNITTQNLSPFIEHVSLWDFYPDMSAKTLDNAKDIIQRHEMDKHKLIALANRKDFKREAIEQYLNFNRDGDFQKEGFQVELDTMGKVQNTAASGEGNTNKYEVLEYWGYVDAYALEMLGAVIPDKMKGLQEVKANIWVLGDRVIKAVTDPLESECWPYYLFYFDKDETSIFGEGVAEILSDVQELMNASFRAMLDNAAISAGPQIEVNLDLLGSDEDPTDIHPFKVWLRTGSGIEAQEPAIRVHTLPSYTNEFIALSNTIERYGDEVSNIPKFLHGGSTQGISGAGRTLGGMSMMMGNANMSIKDQVKNFDDGITKPFISALYDWNMQFNDKPEIKGDFDVVATGTSSLIAKEVYADSLLQFLNITSNPLDSQYAKRQYLLSEVCKSLDLDSRQALYTEQEIAQRSAQAAAAQKEQQEFAMNITETARAGGISPEDLLNHINMLQAEVKQTQQMIAAQQQAGGPSGQPGF